MASLNRSGYEKWAFLLISGDPAPEGDRRDLRLVAAARGLSPREAEVLVFLARGFTPAYIAKSLVLSISTVRTHVRNIYRKLNVNKCEELIHLIDEG